MFKTIMPLDVLGVMACTLMLWPAFNYGRIYERKRLITFQDETLAMQQEAKAILDAFTRQPDGTYRLRVEWQE